jgi:hypothetical protein
MSPDREEAVMAERQKSARKKSRARREDDQPDAEPGGGNGGAVDEQELASYLEERIKPGLNRGSIPMLARSIAREIAHEEYVADDEDALDDEELDDAAEGVSDLAGDLQELQHRLGEDWILSLCVQGDDSWLTAEKHDVSQRIEAQDAAVLVEAVRLLDAGGGRFGAREALDDD